MADTGALKKRRDELLNRLERIRQDIAQLLDRDLEEQAQQLQNRDTLLEIERVTREELAAVERELTKKS